MMPPAAADAFLATCGWGGAAVRPLAGDASFRRYFRVEQDGRVAVLMDAPPPHEDVRPFVAVADYLMAHGFAAPAILGRDLAAGLLLLEDFGDGLMRQVVAADPAGEHDVYARAVDVLAALHRAPPADVPPYDRAAIRREVALFTEWYLPAVGVAVDGAGYDAAWDAVFDALDPAPPVTVLRDYHAENLMPLPDGRLGLLDFQDALVGHPAYDLVSLLQDARRDVAPALEQAMLAHYGPVDPAAYAAWGAQRNVKILGIFARLWKRDGKPRYRAFQPRVWGYLERDLAHPVLAPVRDWFDANLPRHTRAAFWAEYAA